MTGRSRAIPPIVFEGFDEELHEIVAVAGEMLKDRSVHPEFLFDDQVRITSTHYSGHVAGRSVNVTIDQHGSLSIWTNGGGSGRSPSSIGLTVDSDARWPNERAGDPASISSRLTHIDRMLARHGRQRPGRLDAALEAWRRAEEILSAWSQAGDGRRIDFHPEGPWGAGIFTIAGEPVDDATSRWLMANTPSVLMLKRPGVEGWRLGKLRIRRRSSEIAAGVPEAMRIMTKYPEAFR